VVTPARTILVEVLRPDLVLQKVLASRAVLLDRTGRRDVVGGDLVTEYGKNARSEDVINRLRGHAHAFEIGRVLHVSAVIVPAIGEACRGLDRLPVLVALEHVRVLVLEHGPRHVFHDEVLDLVRRRPDILEIDGRAVACRSDRFPGEVLLDGAGKRIGDNERR